MKADLLHHLLRAAFLILPPLAIIVTALPRLVDGIALEQAFPQSALLMTNIGLPHDTYVALERTLAKAPVGDGETQILRVETAVDSGQSPSSVLPAVEEDLSRAPADARGWILFGSLLKNRNPQRAAQALTLTLKLAPFDYYLIMPRTALGAELWDQLSSPERRKVLNDAHTIATSPNRRDDLHALLGTPAGAALVTRALGNDSEGIKRLNRDLAREALHLP